MCGDWLNDPCRGDDMLEGSPEEIAGLAPGTPMPVGREEGALSEAEMLAAADAIDHLNRTLSGKERAEYAVAWLEGIITAVPRLADAEIARRIEAMTMAQAERLLNEADDEVAAGMDALESFKKFVAAMVATSPVAQEGKEP